MAKSIAIKIDGELFRDLHIQAAKRKLTIEQYVTGLIEQDLFPERFSDRFIALTKEQKDQLRAAAHAASASAKLKWELEEARCQDGQIGPMTI
ncbi:MAG: hypothetical protein K2P18_03310 [Oscillospiraceae bacterium]|nr:hypothetical protein [Oscillospiraceae bacterium]